MGGSSGRGLASPTMGTNRSPKPRRTRTHSLRPSASPTCPSQLEVLGTSESTWHDPRTSYGRCFVSFFSKISIFSKIYLICIQRFVCMYVCLHSRRAIQRKIKKQPNKAKVGRVTMVTKAYIPSTWMVEAGGSAGVQGHTWPHS